MQKIAAAKQFKLTEGTDSKSPSKPFIIVGNKCDLEDDRKVPAEVGKELADKYNVPFYECSCFKEIRLDEMWSETVRLYFKMLEEDASAKKAKERAMELEKEMNKKKSTCCGYKKDDEKSTDNIQFFAVGEESLPKDTIQPPVLGIFIDESIY